MSGAIQPLLTIASAVAAVTPGFQWLSPYLLATSMVYGDVQARRAKRKAYAAQRDAYNAGLTDRTVSIVSADNPWQIVYGQPRVAPAYVAMLTSGDKDQYKHVVAVWAAHECVAIEDLQLNGVDVGTLDGSGYVTPGSKWYRDSTDSPSETKTVTSGTLTMDHDVQRFLGISWYPGAVEDGALGFLGPDNVTFSGNVITLNAPFNTDWEGRSVVVQYDWGLHSANLRVRHHLGTDDQTADAALLAELPGDWTASDRGRGLCYSIFSYNLNDPEFQNGPLQPTARVKGRKVYDARLDSTQPGGSGPQRRDDPSTWTWSPNVALCTTDFIRAEWGKRAASNQVDWADVMATANACDTGTDYGAGSVPRFTCHGVVRTDEDPDATLDSLCQAMAGFATWSGVWRMQAGVYTAPVMALTDADNAGAVEVTPGLALGEVINGMRGRYYAPDKFGQLTDYPPYSNAAFVAADGEAWYEDLPLPFTDSPARCHQLARIQVERSRGMQLVYPAKMRAIRLKPGQRITLTCAVLGIYATVFRVVATEYVAGGAVKLTLVLDDASFYDTVDAPAPLSVPAVPTSDQFYVVPPQNLAAQGGGSALQLDTDGSVLQRATITYDASEDVLVQRFGELQVEYRLWNTNTWQRAAPAPGDSTTHGLPPLHENRVYVIRARWKNSRGVASDWRSVLLLTEAVASDAGTTYEGTEAGPVTYANDI